MSPRTYNVDGDIKNFSTLILDCAFCLKIIFLYIGHNLGLSKLRVCEHLDLEATEAVLKHIH